MNKRQKQLLLQHLLDPKASFNQKIGEFIKFFNAGSPDPNPLSEKWNISNNEWQRFEFLGDRVLNLVAAGYLYHDAPAEQEGVLTKRMGVVSNESLAEIIERRGFDVSRLIPDSIGRQKTYGERVKGGALEAFIGALYEIAGFEGTKKCVLILLSEDIEHYNPKKKLYRASPGMVPETGRAPSRLQGDVPDRPGPPPAFYRQGKHRGRKGV